MQGNTEYTKRDTLSTLKNAGLRKKISKENRATCWGASQERGSFLKKPKMPNVNLAMWTLKFEWDTGLALETTLHLPMVTILLDRPSVHSTYYNRAEFQNCEQYSNEKPYFSEKYVAQINPEWIEFKEEQTLFPQIYASPTGDIFIIAHYHAKFQFICKANA